MEPASPRPVEPSKPGSTTEWRIRSIERYTVSRRRCSINSAVPCAMLMRGEGGPVDNTKAWVWLKLSEAGKVAGAPVALAVLERRMTAAERKAAEEIYAPKAG